MAGSDTVLYFTKKEDEAQRGTDLPSHSLPGTQSMHLEKELLLKSIIPSPPFRDSKTGVQGGKEVMAWGRRKHPYELETILPRGQQSTEAHGPNLAGYAL